MVRVLIVDDHAVVRNGLRNIVASELDDVYCGEAGNGEEALTLVRQQPWDLLILDLSLPGRSGIEVLNDLKELNAKPRVLVLSNYPEDLYGTRVLKAGAWGYLSKEAAAEELSRAIRQILAGKRYITSSLADQLARDLWEQEGPTSRTLSDRELEVLQMIASGRTVGEIAEQLHLAVTTVSTYRMRLLEKTQKTTTAELIRYALDNHLVS